VFYFVYLHCLDTCAHTIILSQVVSLYGGMYVRTFKYRLSHYYVIDSPPVSNIPVNTHQYIQWK